MDVVPNNSFRTGKKIHRYYKYNYLTFYETKTTNRIFRKTLHKIRLAIVFRKLIALFSIQFCDSFDIDKQSKRRKSNARSVGKI